MKRVLLVFGSLERSGAQLRMLEICHALRQRGRIHFDFCVLGLGPTQLWKEVESVGGAVHFIPLRSPRFIADFSALLKQGQYDIVSSFPKLLSGIVVWLAARHEVPMNIVNFRNTMGPQLSGNSSLSRLVPSGTLFAGLLRMLIKHNATQVVAVSRAALDSMFPPPWQHGCRCKVIYSGIPLSPYQIPMERQKVRQEFGWPADSRIVVNVARLSPQKNHKALLESFLLAHAECSTIRLLLVGDGKLQGEIDASIDDYGLKNICKMAGLRTDVPRLLRASDVFCFPSLWEGLPGAPLEALAAGLPVVASDIPPIQEIAQHFPSSIFMAAPNDAKQHARHILQALDMIIEPSAVQESFARSPFAFENSIKAYSRLYGVDSHV
jgi:glycosyltransferase EpsF